MKSQKWCRESIQNDFPGQQTLQEILAKLNSTLWTDEHLISEIYLNGEMLDEESEIKNGSMPKDRITSLEIVAKTLPELITNSVETHIKVIPLIKTAAIECSESFRNQHLNLGQKSLTDVLESCHYMTEALSLLKSSIKQWDGFVEFGPEWGVTESQYSQAVNQLVSAYQSHDPLLLADVLEYELTNSLDGWVRVFEKIQKQIENV